MEIDGRTREREREREDEESTQNRRRRQDEDARGEWMEVCKNSAAVIKIRYHPIRIDPRVII